MVRWLLNVSRLTRSARPIERLNHILTYGGHPLRPFLGTIMGTQFSTSGGGKPEWEIAAENEARSAVGDSSRFAKGLAAEERLSNVFMDKVMHEFKSEGVGQTKKLEDRLTAQLAQLHKLLETYDSDSSAQIERSEAGAAFKALRVKAVLTKEEMITQRDAVFGHAAGNTTMLDERFPIPHLPM